MYVCMYVNVIAARQCMHVSVWACARRFLTLVDCCEAMHACGCLCVLVHKAHDHCDCCEAMHACVWLFVCSCAQGA
jgi:hypothetical protein